MTPTPDAKKKSGLARLARLLLRPRVAIPFAFLVVLLLSPWLYRGYRIAQVPDIGDPFDVEKFLDFEVPDERNAFVEYRKAGKMYVDARPKNDKFLSGVIAGRGSGEITDAHHKWLTHNEAALAVWRKGTEKPDALFKHPRDQGLRARSEWAQLELRQFIFLAFVRSEILQRRGKPTKAFEWLRAAYRCTRHCAVHTTSRLESTVYHRFVCGAIVSWASYPGVSVAQIRRARREVMELYAMTPPASDAVKADYIVYSRFLQRDDPVKRLKSLYSDLGVLDYGMRLRFDRWFWLSGDRLSAVACFNTSLRTGWPRSIDPNGKDVPVAHPSVHRGGPS